MKNVHSFNTKDKLSLKLFLNNNSNILIYQELQNNEVEYFSIFKRYEYQNCFV